jgi:hypothetical protein
MTTKRALARDLLLYIVKPDALKKSRIEVIGRQYAVALGMDPNQWRASLDTLKKLRVQ